MSLAAALPPLPRRETPEAAPAAELSLSALPSFEVSVDYGSGFESLLITSSAGRLMNVATLRVALRLGNGMVMERIGRRWVPLGEDAVIDLLDQSTRYRFGTVTVLS